MASNNTTTSNDFDNPWESAANDRMYDGDGDGDRDGDGEEQPPRTLSFSQSSGGGGLGVMTSTPNGNNSNNNSNNSRSCAFQCFQACHLLDMFMSLLLTIYVAIVLWKPQHGLALCGIALASIWMSRALLAKTTKCGVHVSSTMSLVLSVLYAGLSLVNWIVQWEAQATIVPIQWAQQHPKALSFLLLGFSVLECIRWAWIQQWLQQEREQQQQNSSTDYYNDDTTWPAAARRSPWWWRDNQNGNNNRQGHEPLLSSSDDDGRPHWSSSNSRAYHMDDGVANNNSRRSSSWWPFSNSNRNANGNGNGNGPRDDGSVDYASLNEDWASRSQQDPLWWAKENE